MGWYNIFMPKGYFTDRTLWLQKKREASIKARKPIDVELLKKRYLVDKISTYALQKEFNLTNTAIRNRLKGMGIQLRGWRDAQLLIPHESPIEKIGFDKWYSLTQSLEARKKRSISHTGKKFTEERKKHMSDGIGKGNSNKIYIGDRATYGAKHLWINKHYIKTGICEDCGGKPLPFTKNKIGTEWANVSGKYDREDRNDWRELCRSCHKKFDLKPKL